MIIKRYEPATRPDLLRGFLFSWPARAKRRGMEMDQDAGSGSRWEVTWDPGITS